MCFVFQDEQSKLLNNLKLLSNNHPILEAFYVYKSNNKLNNKIS